MNHLSWNDPAIDRNTLVERRERRELSFGFVLGASMLAAFVFVGVPLFYITSSALDREAKRCENKGGHIINIGRDYLCITKDGRVLE